MATGRDNNDWHESGLIRRDFRQDHGSGPEEMKGRPKRKQKKWCKREGREHDYQKTIYASFTYVDHNGKAREHVSYRWVCQGCGKVGWGYPKPEVDKHEHHYCLTEISEKCWKNQQEIFEKCCVCGGKGRSYKFYDK